MNREKAPTTLHLFRADELIREDIPSLVTHFDHFSSESRRANGAYLKYREATIARKERLSRKFLFDHDKLLTAQSSETTSLAFMALDRTFLASGASRDEAFELFRGCIDTSIKYHQRMREVKTGKKKQHELPARLTVIEKGAIRDVFGRSITAPQWFRGTEDAWTSLLLSSIRIDQVISEGLGHSGVVLPHEFRSRCCIIPDKLPDWLESDERPELWEVIAELGQDQGEINEIIKRKAMIEGQISGLNSELITKAKVLLDWREGRFEQFSSRVNSFPSMVLFLNALPDIASVEYDATKSDRDKSVKADISDASLQYSRTRNTTGRKENVALYMETALVNGGVFSSMQEPLTEDHLLRLYRIFPQLQSTTSAQERLSSRQQEALDLMLRPLFWGVSRDEIIYFSELVYDYIGEPIEKTIWEMADLIEQSTGRQVEVPSNDEVKRIAIARDLFRAHTHNWLRVHHRWAAAELVETLRKNAEVSSDPVVIEELEEPKSEQLAEAITDLEQLTEEHSRDILEDWRIFIITNPNLVDLKHLVEVSGDTPEERIEAIRKYFLINSNYKPKAEAVYDEIVYAIEAQGSTEEQIRKKHETSQGVVYSKSNFQDHGRFMYQVDEGEKAIKFWVDRKKARAYRMRREGKI